MSMSRATLPVFEIGLNALSGLLDKAEAYAGSRQIDLAVLLNARLFPDMFAFTRQAQIVCDLAKNGGARLAGIEAPKYEDNEQTLADLRVRLGKTLAFVRTLDAAAIDAAGEREITFPLGRQNTARMRGADYLNHFVLPNFYFHLSTAYGILRHSGVEVGKRDYLGAIPMAIA